MTSAEEVLNAKRDIVFCGSEEPLDWEQIEAINWAFATLQSILAMPFKNEMSEEVDNDLMARGYNRHRSEVRALIEKGVE